LERVNGLLLDPSRSGKQSGRASSAPHLDFACLATGDAFPNRVIQSGVQFNRLKNKKADV
jgi:hypothetical protein